MDVQTFFYDYKVVTPFRLYPTVTGIIMSRLKSIRKFKNSIQLCDCLKSCFKLQQNLAFQAKTVYSLF